jgi:hypothetical protein
MTSSETATVTLRIIRVGECKQCGWCCGFVDGKITEGACSHLTSDGKCSIHDRLEEFCPEHGRTHEDCIRNPEFPLRKQNPKCGYRFYIEGSNAEVINIELADWEFLSRHG